MHENMCVLSNLRNKQKQNKRWWVNNGQSSRFISSNRYFKYGTIAIVIKYEALSLRNLHISKLIGLNTSRRPHSSLWNWKLNFDARTKLLSKHDLPTDVMIENGKIMPWNRNEWMKSTELQSLLGFFPINSMSRSPISKTTDRILGLAFKLR